MRKKGTYRDTTYLKNIDCVMTRKEGGEGWDTLVKDYMAWINYHKKIGGKCHLCFSNIINLLF